LHSFGGPGSTDGDNPQGDLVQGTDGALYGLTGAGGGAAIATLFRITRGGIESILFTFPGTLAYPSGSLLQGSDGNFYALSGYPATISGSPFKGAVLQVTPAGSGNVLYTFDPQNTSTGDAVDPVGLTQANDGNLYGESWLGGANGCGTIFKVTLSGTETLLHSFPCGNTVSNSGHSRLIQASDGNLYGMTSAVGTNTGSTLFKITLDGTYSVVYTFGTNALDGAAPFGGVIQASDGNFYGMTAEGGANGYGTIFKVTPAGDETVIYSFGQSSVQVNGNAIPGDGYGPTGNLVQASDGNFYGMTSLGGTYGNGTIFQVTPSGVHTVLYSFTGTLPDGSHPGGSLIQASDGRFYGVAGGGAYNLGVVFSFAAP